MKPSKVFIAALATLGLVACSGRSAKPSQAATLVVQGQIQSLTLDLPAISSVALTLDGTPMQNSPFTVTAGRFGPVSAIVAPGSHTIAASATDGTTTFTATATLDATFTGPNSVTLYLVDTRYQQGSHTVPIVEAVSASPSTLVVTSGSPAATSVLSSTTIFESGVTKIYRWQDSCAGTFDDATAASPIYTPPAFAGQNSISCTLTLTATAGTTHGDVSDPVFSVGRQSVTVTYVTPLQIDGYVVPAPLFDYASLVFPGISETDTCALDWLSTSGGPNVALSADRCDAQLFGSADPAGRPIVMQATFAPPPGPAGTVAVSAKGSVTCGGSSTGELAGSVAGGVASFTWNAANVMAETACNAVLTVTFTAPGSSSPSSISSSLPVAFLLHPAKAQGFEAGTSGWLGGTIAAVASGSGTLALDASSGAFYAEIQNAPNNYLPGYGDAGYSRFGGKGTLYKGDFYQAIDVYLDVSWAPPSIAGADGFFVDMTPHHEDPDNYGAEHTFYVHATGTNVTVRADTQTVPFANITTSGWYTFVITWQKGATDDDPVLSQMAVFDAKHRTVVGQVTVSADHDLPTRQFTGKDLRGNGYVWITGWPNGFANDVLAVDNLRTALLPY